MRLGDFCTTNIKSYSEKENWNVIYYLDTSNLTKGKISEIQTLIPDIDKIPSRAKRKVSEGDILFSTVRPNQRHYGIIKKEIPYLLVSTGFAVITVNKKIADEDYIYYFLTQDQIIEHLQTIAEQSTSAYPSIKPTDIENIEINLPTLSVQKAIGNLLRALDEKIEVNNRINDNLEQQISEIYKAWYQDFSCAANVPMVASEYGIIPQGWHYSMLSDLCKSISVTHKFDTDKLIFLNTGDIEDGRFLHENYMAVSEMPGQAKKSIALGDILFSEIRPTNRHFAYVNFPAKDYVVSTKLMVIRATSLDSRRLYHFLTLQDVLAELQMQAESRSGTFPQIRFDNVSKLPILIADDKTETAFTDLLHTVYAQIEHNNLENGKLRALRDNLLPRLISGELDVSELDI